MIRAIRVRVPSVTLMEKHILCYVEDHWAYFTDMLLDKQRGDDWNDRPYEHNAGLPYRRDINMPNSQGRIIKVLWGCDVLETPAQRHGPNSPFSVEEINALETPWLAPGAGCRSLRHQTTAVIMAGCSIAEFISLITLAGGCAVVAP